MSENGFQRGERVEGPAELAAGLFGITLPIVTAAVFVATLFSPGLWALVPTVMFAVAAVNLANIGVFLGLVRGRKGSDGLRNRLSIGAVFSGICISAVLVLAGWFAALGG